MVRDLNVIYMTHITPHFMWNKIPTTWKDSQ